jgi:hypothetical protein
MWITENHVTIFSAGDEAEKATQPQRQSEEIVHAFGTSEKNWYPKSGGEMGLFRSKAIDELKTYDRRKGQPDQSGLPVIVTYQKISHGATHALQVFHLVKKMVFPD